MMNVRQHQLDLLQKKALAPPPRHPPVLMEHRNYRKVSIGTEVEARPAPRSQTKNEDAAALLLLNMSQIVQDEYQHNHECLASEEEKTATANATPSPDQHHPHHHTTHLTWRRLTCTPSPIPEDKAMPELPRFLVSTPPHAMTLVAGGSKSQPQQLPAIVSPNHHRGGRPVRKARLKSKPHRANSGASNRSLSALPPAVLQLPKTDPKSLVARAVANAAKKGRPVKTIMRKKFSWKNHPELEAFLVANREEYLRHSALNYTVQQKHYNNRLTEELLDLAAEEGYVFDQDEFNFVTVRDRIRCYFKSYVQSAKKKGIIIGYAARKAGLLSEEDLEKSAHQEGKIVVPPH